MCCRARKSSITAYASPSIVVSSFPMIVDIADRGLHFLSPEQGVVPIGSVLAIELKDDTGSGYASTAPQYIVSRLRRDTFGATDLNVFARPLGNVVYLMTSQVTAPRQVREIERLLVECLEAGRNSWTGLDEGSGVVYC
ncbi:LOW QUALITY PROTEIN: hypothetical protein BC936DRAFT_145986 [Jimgerdemannia flammicorona]|uniref:Uncharacterized protein n=1 Tax=Jimgerdemannia flammicorona TaxID=994334 RepID=A0A433DLN8_9FUNG|nr:LOW QUALITY PROTEIN: hypothetical protein BC936DRAFT_145986 [Jimgerdemannia flammicorona]